MSFELFNAFKERGIRPKLPKPVEQAVKPPTPSQTCTDHKEKLYMEHAGTNSRGDTFYFEVFSCVTCKEKRYVGYKKR